MDNAVALNQPIPIVLQDSFSNRIKAMPARSKLGLGIGIAALAADPLHASLVAVQSPSAAPPATLAARCLAMDCGSDRPVPGARARRPSAQASASPSLACSNRQY